MLHFHLPLTSLLSTPYLDDIGFNLSKIEVLGQRMRQAVTAPAFRIEFEKQKHHCRKQDAILKSLYFLNFGCFLAGLIVVSIRQSSGYYQVSTYYQACIYFIINA